MQSAEVALSFTLGQNKLQFWLGLNWIAVGGGYWLVGGGRRRAWHWVGCQTLWHKLLMSSFYLRFAWPRPPFVTQMKSARAKLH